MEGGEESLNLGLAAKLKDVEMIEPRPQLVEHNDTRNSPLKPPCIEAIKSQVENEH